MVNGNIPFIPFMFQVEFAAPVGYQEPQRMKRRDDDEEENVNHQQNHYEATNFVKFSGEGNRLDGKKKKCDKIETVQSPVVCIKFASVRLTYCIFHLNFSLLDIC